MTNRVNNYYRYPAKPDFVRHMIHDLGFNESDISIITNLRECVGDTEIHAQAVRLPTKLYNERVCKISVRMVDELFRLAQIGYEVEQQSLKTE